MSFMSVRSVSSGTCSNSSHWSTSAPLTPTYFPDPIENPLPPLKRSAAAELAVTASRRPSLDTNASEDDRLEVVADALETTPKRKVPPRTAHTPYASAPGTASREDSSSPFDVATPSPSIHQYSSALRETMRKRYDEAFKRMNSGDGKMALDLSWEDEDPIDRHVRMSSLRQEAEARRKKAATASASVAGHGAVKTPSGMPIESDPMLGKAGPSSQTLDDGLPPVRPTLLDFRGYSHLNTSSLGSRSDGGGDGDGEDYDNTPGSIGSEASFEAGSKEDWVDMYGRSQSGGQTSTINAVHALLPLESPSIAYRMSQASISTFGSTDTSSSQATVLPPRQRTSSSSSRPFSMCSAQIQLQAQGQVQAYAQPCDASPPPHLFQPLPTPAPLSQLATGYFAIPTQTVPAPVSRAYPTRPTMGTRQRSRNHPYANALEIKRDQSGSGGDVRPPLVPRVSASTPGIGEDEYPERSASEMMVLRAGLRSQRSRAGGRN